MRSIAPEDARRCICVPSGTALTRAALTRPMRDEDRAFFAGLAAGLLLAVALRAFLSTLFYESLATLRLNATAAWMLVLLAPLAAPLVRDARWPLALAGSATAAFVLTRVFEGYVPVPVAAVASAAALLALAQREGPGLAGGACGVGLAGATLLLDASNDPFLSLGGALVLALLAALALPLHRRGSEAPTPRWLDGVSFAALLAAQLAFLASPYALARHLQADVAHLAFALVAGLVVGATLLPRAGFWLPVAAALALVDVAFVRSPVSLLSLALLQAALGAAAARSTRPHPVAFALVLGPTLFGLLFFGGVLGVREWTLAMPLLALLALAPLVRARPRVPRRAPWGAGTLGLVALVVLLADAPPGPAAPERTDELTVVSWNVHQGFGNRGSLDPALYAEALRAMDPDVVLLQEADTTHLSSGGLDVPTYLAHALGMHVGPRASALVVLSRFPVADVPRPEPTGWSVETPLQVGDRVVWAQSVHLARSRDERALQAQEILVAADARPGLRIVGGDLNSCPTPTCFGSRPSDRMHAILQERYEDAWSAHHAPDDPAGNTHPARAPSRRIDVIMVTGLEVVEAGPVLDERTRLGSDHLPMRALLRLPDAQPPLREGSF